MLRGVDLIDAILAAVRVVSDQSSFSVLSLARISNRQESMDSGGRHNRHHQWWRGRQEAGVHHPKFGCCSLLVAATVLYHYIWYLVVPCLLSPIEFQFTVVP